MTQALFRRFRRDNRGSIALVSTAGVLLTTLCAGFVADFASIHTTRRKAQTAADLAAISAAAQLADAPRAAALSIAENGIAAPGRLAVVTGLYEGDPARARESRFTAGAPAPNAVRVELETSARLVFGRFLLGRETQSVRVDAVAAESRSAGFTVGSRLARFEGGALNGLTNALLGTSLSLTAMDYEGLANARISLFGYLGALATEIDLVGGDWNSVLGASVSAGKAANAMARALAARGGADPRVEATLRDIAREADRANLATRTGALIHLGPYGRLARGDVPDFDISVSALDLLMAHAKTANAGRFLDTGLNLAVPGLASARLSLVIGERPQGAHWVAIGPSGTRVHTAQTRLLLDLRIGGTGLLAGTQVRLPVYLEAAAADARLDLVRCGASREDIAVTIGTRPGVLDAWVADVTPAMMTNVATPVNPPAVEIVRLPLASVAGRAHATMRNNAYEPLRFDNSDIERNRLRTATTRDFTASLTTALVRDLDLQVQVLGLGLGLGGGAARNAVASLLQGVTAPVDDALASLTGALGIGLGQADVRVGHARCDGAVLVQ